MSSFFIQTFGCRVNQAEAFVWSEALQKKGLEQGTNPFLSDLVIVNSCTLTAGADRDVRRFLRGVARKNPEARVVVTGCFVEKNPREMKKYPSAWICLSNREKELLPERINPLFPSLEALPVKPFRSRALVKIQDGCDFRCAFCVIPGVRGKSRSIPADRVLNRIRDCIEHGYREIVLTGINLASYGSNPEAGMTFGGLLTEIEKLPGLGRFRLSSLDPRFMDRDFLENLAGCSKVCPHFHLSLQHGADPVIRRMGRNISVRRYREILTFLEDVFPEAALGADIITGFPGETSRDFEKAYAFLEGSPLTYFHVFPYSQRPGTPAADWPQVKNRDKKTRARMLRELSLQKTRAFRRRFVGRERPAVVVRKTPDRIDVLTDNYIQTFLPPGPASERSDVFVRMTGEEEKGTRGEWVPSAGC